MRQEQGYSTKSGGFSMLELIVVISVIAILVTIAIDRLLPIRVDAERVAMENVVGALRSAIGMKFAQIVVKKGARGAKTMVGSNPMALLSEQPSNYLGEVDRADPGSMEAGSWYFNKSSRALVYKIWNTEHFSGGLANPARARFVIRPVYAPGGSKRGIEGLKLEAVEDYRWTQ